MKTVTRAVATAAAIIAGATTAAPWEPCTVTLVDEDPNPAAIRNFEDGEQRFVLLRAYNPTAATVEVLRGVSKASWKDGDWLFQIEFKDGGTGVYSVVNLDDDGNVRNLRQVEFTTDCPVAMKPEAESTGFGPLGR